jgi:hypothetical protein
MTIPKFKFQGLFNQLKTYVKLYVQNKEYDVPLKDLFASIDSTDIDINELLPYKTYTAKLTQTGSPEVLSSPTSLVIGRKYTIDNYISQKTFVSGTLTVGYTYIINNLNMTDNFFNVGFVSLGTPFVATGTTPTVWTGGTEVLTAIPDDFTNVGAPSNATGVTFIATGTTPASWENNSQLVYNADPVIEVFENTIGNLSVTYSGEGNAKIQSLLPLFEFNKTFVQITSGTNGVSQNLSAERINANEIGIVAKNNNVAENNWTAYLQIKLYK